MPKDYYETLGVSRTASADEIKKSYRKLSRQYHPDMKPGDKQAEAKFKEVQQAYDVVGDADKRKKYDQFGHAFDQAGGPGGGFNWQGGPGGQGGMQFDLGDIFGQGGIDLGDIFGGGAFGGGGRGGAKRGRARKGQDVQATVQIPFLIAALGGEHDVTLTTGDRSERLTLKIPAGVDNGSVIRLAGQGQPGTGKAPPGDLLVTLQVTPHGYFRREGSSVLVDVPVSMIEAALGAKVDVPTLSDGIVSMSIPAGSASGMKLRLRGKGVVDLKTKERGDQYAVLKIVTPKQLDAASQELLQKFAELNPQNPRQGLWGQ